MFTETPCCEECKDMCLLWKANARKTEEQILLSGMQTSRENDEKIKDLSTVQCLLHPEDYESGVLFEDLCQQRPFEEHDRYGEFELQGRDKLCKAIQGNEKACSDKGYENMRSMWEDEALTCSSCRREPTEQPTREPDNTLQDMSFCSPQIGTDTISTIERVSGDSHTVYDIQVEDCNNFFAGNILVHNCLIIDDPVKNAEEANSKTYRDKAAEWYKSTAYTRIEPGGAVVIIQTRWHEDDLSGRLLTEEPDKWTVISLPALADHADPLGRQPGEPLFPKRYDVPALEEIKRTLGGYWWNALYQQRPQSQEGGLFKQQYFKYWKPMDNGYDLGHKKIPTSTCRIFQTCDPAASTKTTADYFVLSTWAQTKDNDLVLLDVLRARLEGPDQVSLFRQQYHRWSPAFQAVESVGLGKTLYQLLVREGLPIRELKPDRDKVTRALPAAARMEAGTIYFPANAPWLADFESELLTFPTGVHDDQVDTLSYAVQLIAQKRSFHASAYVN
jgi:predicted phage terminase large subunit-like protein